MNKVIHINRDFPTPYLYAHKRIHELSVEQVVRKYQGFQGDLIASQPTFNEISELNSDNDTLILFIRTDSSETSPLLKELSVFVGFDVGVCEEEKTIYSSIFNEVLFGNLQELISFKDSLNEHLLFPDSFLALEYVKLHNELSAQGADVEDYEKMLIYEIWKIPHRK